MKIFKYPLEMNASQNVMLPFGAQVLSAGMQGDTLCIWAMVDDANPKAPRRFEIYTTGEWVGGDDPGRFLATVFVGNLVFHLFDTDGAE